MRVNVLIVLICLGFLCGAANVFALNTPPITFSGYFNDNSNLALFGSDLQDPQFGFDSSGYDLAANNVAIYDLSIPDAGDVTFTSKGFAAGGAQPYFSLFEGNTDAATFLDSNYSIFYIDFSLSRLLVAGDYTIALGVWMNMSSAENNPDGDPTLGDGFSQLGVPEYLGNYYYELEVTMPDQVPVPEPGTILLTMLGLFGLAGLKKKSGS